jgi:hypothetical protein
VQEYLTRDDDGEIFRCGWTRQKVANRRMNGRYAEECDSS